MDPVFEAGLEAGPEELHFARIESLAFDGRGRLWVLDGLEDRMVVIDPEGRFERTVGRSGRGPGEFSRPVALDIDDVGHVLVFDAGTALFSVWSLDGELLSTRRPPIGASYPGTLLRAWGDRKLFSAAGQGIAVYDPAVGEPADYSINLFDLAGDQGPALRTRAWKPDPTGVVDRRQMDDRRVAMQVMPLFLPTLHFDARSDGTLLHVDSVDYRIEAAGPDGRVRVWATRDVPPRAPTSGDVDRERARLSESTGRVGGTPLGGPGARRSELPVWPIRQVVDGLRIDRRDRVWVQRTEEDGSTIVDLFDTGGRYVGSLPSLRLPDAFGPEGVVAWIEVGPVGEPIVRVARISIDG